MSARVRLDHDRISFRRLRDLRALRLEHLPGRSALPRAIQRQPVHGKNEQRHLLPLLDRLAERGHVPKELWADRGYDAEGLRKQLRDREIEPHISKRRRAGDPIPPGTPTRTSYRGGQKRIKTADPLGRHRWPVARTNAWLHAFRRIATRRDRKASVYLAFVQLAMILILTRAF